MYANLAVVERQISNIWLLFLSQSRWTKRKPALESSVVQNLWMLLMIEASVKLIPQIF